MLHELAENLVGKIRSLSIPLQSEKPTKDPEVWDISLTYGELSPSSVVEIIEMSLKHCLLPTPHRFFDIGSGHGFPSIIAATLFPVIAFSGGVEILPSHFSTSLRNQAAAVSLVESEVRNRVEGVDFRCGDVLSEENTSLLKDCSLLFCNSTAFSESLLAGLFKAIEGIKPGAVFVCTSQKLSSPLFELLEEKVLKSSWGEATVRVYRRKRIPLWVKGFGRNKI